MKKNILIFGVGPLQKSIIECCKTKELFTIGIDPDRNATCKNIVDVFEVVGCQDYEGTIKVAKKYNITGIITSATDKPLVMMARIAEALNLPFFSVETAKCSTDKYLMKQKFQEAEIPCTKGFLLNNVDELSLSSVEYPVIVKPRDNSGSRGVIYCEDYTTLQSAIKEALHFTKKGNVLVEEFIGGKEYSVEGIHYNGGSYVIQITEKITTKFPYNVELGHLQPAVLSSEQQLKIQRLITKIAHVLGFENCASHTELKINDRGIFVIETSPRLGGDYITSTLVPLSTGINIEDLLIYIALGKSIDTLENRVEKASGVCFFTFKEGRVSKIDSEFENVNNWPGIYSCELKLKENNKVPPITSSLSRYGQFIVCTKTRKELDDIMKEYQKRISSFVKIF